jgi:integrase/recombinase XerC
MKYTKSREEVTNFIAKLDASDNTRKTYLWALNRYFEIVGDMPLNVETYEKFLMGIRNHSPSTKRILRVAVMKFYEYHDATHPRMQTLNNIYSRKAKKHPVNFDYEAVQKLLSHCDNLRGDLISLRDRAFILTLADSGLRISELAGLKRGDIDWNERSTVVTGKGDKVALVRLSNRSIDALKEYLHMRAKMDGASKKLLNSLPLFAQHGRINHTKAMSVDGMRQSLVARMEEAGVRFRVHDLRHYFVTYILKSTGNIKKAQVLARHESQSTTLLYAHLVDDEADQAYDEIFNR